MWSKSKSKSKSMKASKNRCRTTDHIRETSWHIEQTTTFCISLKIFPNQQPNTNLYIDQWPYHKDQSIQQKDHRITCISKKVLMEEKKKCDLSWPAVSQICALTSLLSTGTLRVANSTPMVDLVSKLNSFRVNRDKRLDLPTPESPMRTSLNK